MGRINIYCLIGFTLLGRMGWKKKKKPEWADPYLQG